MLLIFQTCCENTLFSFCVPMPLPYITPAEFNPERVRIPPAPKATTTGFAVLYEYSGERVLPLRLLLSSNDTVAPFGLSAVVSEELKKLKVPGTRLQRRSPDEVERLFAEAPEQLEWSMQVRATPFITSALAPISARIEALLPELAKTHFNWRPSMMQWLTTRAGIDAVFHNYIKTPKDHEKAVQYGSTVKFVVYPPNEDRAARGTVFFTADNQVIPWKSASGQSVIRRLCPATNSSSSLTVPHALVTARVWGNTSQCGVTWTLVQAQTSPPTQDDAHVPVFPPSARAAAVPDFSEVPREDLIAWEAIPAGGDPLGQDDGDLPTGPAGEAAATAAVSDAKRRKVPRA